MKVFFLLSQAKIQTSHLALPGTVVLRTPRGNHTAQDNYARVQGEIQLAVHLVYPQGTPLLAAQRCHMCTLEENFWYCYLFLCMLNPQLKENAWKTRSMSSTPVYLHCHNKISWPLPLILFCWLCLYRPFLSWTSILAQTFIFTWSIARILVVSLPAMPSFLNNTLI